MVPEAILEKLEPMNKVLEYTEGGGRNGNFLPEKVILWCYNRYII